ncbi:30S ribosomal protein S17 [bacterium]|nr:30S ribosomal protein S17 [candidate division CSSED10-310 bacterium]
MRQPGNRKKRVGIVVSDKMDKTVVVEVTRSFIHGKYKSIVRSRKKFLAHDQNNECHIGDVVRIEETRPLSKSKHWRVREVVEKAR